MKNEDKQNQNRNALDDEQLKDVAGGRNYGLGIYGCAYCQKGVTAETFPCSACTNGYFICEHLGIYEVETGDTEFKCIALDFIKKGDPLKIISWVDFSGDR